MSGLLSYKNYNGTVEYSKEDRCLYGKVVGLKSLLSYEGDSVSALEVDFQNVIDEYLKDCEASGVRAEQPFKGTFNVRISPALHRGIATYAMEQKESLNAAVEKAIERMVLDVNAKANLAAYEEAFRNKSKEEIECTIEDIQKELERVIVLHEGLLQRKQVCEALLGTMK